LRKGKQLIIFYLPEKNNLKKRSILLKIKKRRRDKMLGKSKENLLLLVNYIKHHFKRTRNKYRGAKSVLLFPVLGLISLLWVIIRVGTKPSRLRYPCMKVAVPTATSFIAYIIAIFTSLFSFHKAKEKLRNSKYSLGIILLLISVAGGTFLVLHTNKSAYARIPSYKVRAPEPNQPMGEEKGIFPGRVVWVYDPDATNENCKPWIPNYDDGWFLSKNNDQEVIDSMLSKGLRALTGTDDDSLAWVEIFKYFNENHEKGAVSYTPGEKIFIKINATSAWSGNYNPTDLSKANNIYYGVVETSPHVILSVLRQLVNVLGVSQADISVGDPMKHIYKHCYEVMYPEFENVIYLDNDHSNLGRTMVTPGLYDTVFYSDRGALISAESDKLYTVQEEADYIINIPSLKGHLRAGMTLFAKNHFGSHTRNSADHLHPGLVNPDGSTETGDERYGYGRYRVQVDLLGHELIGGKELFYLADALWATSHEINNANKWYMEPFNGDWCSSLFLSQDPIAIASVGYDFLQAEFQEEQTDTMPHRSTCIQMEGTDDYLHQAADSDNWTDSITQYDPENDGTPIPSSLGVHEHWNNAIDKQYSRNLGGDYGIELVKILPEIVPAITITSPNGGEDWYVGSDHNITWTSSSTSGNVQIEYSTNNGSSWTEEIASTTDDGSYSWTVPDVPSDNCLVRVSDTEGTPADTSDAVFSILPVPSYITITSPNGGEDWYVDSTYNITWTSSNTSGNVQIEYSTNNGSSWTEEIASTTDDGSYSWTVPDAPSDNCLVRVSDTEGTPADTSDAVFTILPASGVPLAQLPEVYSMSVKRVTADKNFEIRYTLPEETTLRFGVYDITGKIIREFSKEQMQGSYSEKIDMRGEPAGVYFVRMEANGRKFTQTNKVLLVK
jgi:hypothetical protein